MDATVRRRRLHRRLPASADPRRDGLRLERAGRAADRRRASAGRRRRRRGFPHRARLDARARTASTRAGLRDRFLRRRPHGQPARLRRLRPSSQPSHPSAACAYRPRAPPPAPVRSSPSTAPPTRSTPTTATASRTGPTRSRRPPRTGVAGQVLRLAGDHDAAAGFTLTSTPAAGRRRRSSSTRSPAKVTNGPAVRGYPAHHQNARAAVDAVDANARCGPSSPPTRCPSRAAVSEA